MQAPPHASAQDQVDAYVAGKLDAVARRIRWVDSAAAAVGLLAIALAYLLGMVAADHLLDDGVPLLARRVLGALAAGGLALAFYVRIIRPYMQPLNDRYVARLIEKHYPDLRNGLITLLDVGGRNEVHAGVVASVLERTARDLSGKSTVVAVPMQPIRRAAGLGLAMVVVYLLYALLSAKALLPSIARTFGADVAAPTRTQAAWLSPDDNLSIVRGTPVELKAAISGQRPDRVFVEYATDANTNWSAQPPTDLLPPVDRAAGTSVWSAMLAGRDVRTPILCRIRAGDGVSPTRRIDVRPVPAESAISYTLQPPAYTGMPAVQLTESNLDVVVGTRVTAHLVANVPVRSGVLRMEQVTGQETLVLERDSADLHRLRGEWIADSDAEFRVELRDIYGVPSAPAPPHRQVVRLDAAPMIEMQAPLADLELDAGASFEINAVARDDFGVAQVALVYRVASRAGRVQLSRAESPTRTVDVASRMAIADLAGNPGDVIDCHLEAIDNRVMPDGSAGGQLATGPAWRIRVSAIQMAKNEPRRSDPAELADNRTKDGAADNNSDKGNDGESGGEPTNQPAGEQPSEGATQLKNTGNEQGTDSPPDEKAIEKLVEQMEKQDGPPNKQPGDESGDQKNNPRDTKTPGEQDKSSPRKPDSGGSQKSDGDEKKDTTGDKGSGDGARQKDKPGSKTSGADSKTQKNTEPPSDESQKKEPADMNGGDGSRTAQDDGGSRPPQGDEKPDGQKPDNKSRDTNGQEQPPAEPKDSGNGRQDKQDGESKQPGGSDSDDQQGEKPSDKQQPGDGQTDPKGGEPKTNGGDNGGQQQKDKVPTDAPPGDKSAADPSGNDGKSQKSQPGAKSADNNKPASGEGQPGQPGEQPGGGNDRPRAGAQAEDKPAEPSGNEGLFDGDDAGAVNSRRIGMDRVDRAVNELERRMREGRLSDDTLRELGWTRAQAERFVRQYRHNESASGGGPAQTESPARSRRVGSRNGDSQQVRRATHSGGALSGGTDALTGGKPSTPSVRDRPHEDVPPELRDVLDAYYRTMARERTQDNPAPPPP